MLRVFDPRAQLTPVQVSPPLLISTLNIKNDPNCCENEVIFLFSWFGPIRKSQAAVIELFYVFI